MDSYKLMHAEPKEILGEFLTHMRERAEKSQRQLGEIIGKHQSEISKYERAAQVPSKKTLDQIVEKLCNTQIEQWAIEQLWRQSRR